MPVLGYTGVDAKRYSRAMQRLRVSGYDLRLAPYVWADDITQRYYDLFDAWVNRGYGTSDYWPPRRGKKVIVGKDPDGAQPQLNLSVSYRPDPSRIAVWGIGGTLEAELAERGTLAMPRHHSIGQPHPGPYPLR